MLTLCLAGGQVLAEAQSRTDEYRLKAAFLFHFSELVDWPSEVLRRGDPLTLCTIGNDPFDGDLEAAVAGKLAGTRSLRILHFKSTEKVDGCQVLFIGVEDHARVSLLLARLKSVPVLTVGETDDFVKQGGMIGFCLEGNKVRFEINLESSQRAGLKISSRLLLLAKSVAGGRR
jgi:YfiR/HmsC-like